ncbi:MAG: metal ABC transporter ATP-binding protein [Actinomycetota bacterium]|nr:metal ABC transporter ATP-binding protein [Rubrobacter sp.]MDQ3509576.1 metal ABC transporter ATP-binding protein [Actinomycetota bacterium]
MENAALEVRELTVSYGDGRPALERASLSLPRGEILGVVGPNGGGKSTLLKGILGIAPVSSGKVFVAGNKVDRRSRRLIGYVPQREEVDWKFPVSAFDVVMMGRVPSMKLFRRPSSEDKKAVWKALADVGMADFADKQIGEFSGGQQQRIFLGRALAQGAEVLLLDEPVSGVDAPSQREVFGLLNDLREAGKTVVVTTHDLSSVAERFGLALILNRRVVAVGRPEDVFTAEILNEAYDSSLMILNVGGRTIAVEDVNHHPTEHRA